MTAAQSPVEKPEAGRESDNCGWWLLSKNKQKNKQRSAFTEEGRKWMNRSKPGSMEAEEALLTS